jgi:hypothetical protein
MAIAYDNFQKFESRKRTWTWWPRWVVFIFIHIMRSFLWAKHILYHWIKCGNMASLNQTTKIFKIKIIYLFWKVFQCLFYVTKCHVWHKRNLLNTTQGVYMCFPCSRFFTINPVIKERFTIRLSASSMRLASHSSANVCHIIWDAGSDVK